MKSLASLFDGIGGFPLSSAMCGIEPRWASEIEPFPILTTHKRFPNMKHVGNVTQINGAEVEPVDIITFGSPCQDLSVAGKQAGIHDGERSNLFFEAVRIIKEMRANDQTAGRPAELCRPRFAVWENVPGAFSSNKGRDFQAVLQALAEVADPDVSVPESDKWAKSGCIVGEGWSIAWRVYDAQFWGVPQRRKRIYLIADFGSERAGEILFEQEGVRSDSAQGGTARQGTAADAEGGADGGCAASFVGSQNTTVYSFDSIASNSMKSKNPYSGCREVEVAKTLDTSYPDPSKNQGGVAIVETVPYTRKVRSGVAVNAAGFVGRQGDGAGSVGFEMEKAPTLRSAITSDVCYRSCLNPWDVQIRRVFTPDGAWPSLYSGEGGGHGYVYCLQGNGIDRADTAGCNGKGWKEDTSYTLNTIDRPAVALDCRNMPASEELSGTLQAKSQGGYSLNYQNPVVYPGVGITSPDNGANPQPGDPCGTLSTDSRNYLVYDACGNGDGEITPTLTGDHQNRITDYTGIAVHGFDMQAFGKYSDCGTSSTLKQRDYKDATDLVVENGRHYIVRRLIPLECCRLQGYPDGWTENLAITNPTDEEIDFFTKVWSDWAAINGVKPKSRSQVIKWLADPQSDSAEYKAYGNSLAIPCAYDVIRRVAKA